MGPNRRAARARGCPGFDERVDCSRLPSALVVASSCKGNRTARPTPGALRGSYGPTADLIRCGWSPMLRHTATATAMPPAFIATEGFCPVSERTCNSPSTPAAERVRASTSRAAPHTTTASPLASIAEIVARVERSETRGHPAPRTQCSRITLCLRCAETKLHPGYDDEAIENSP